MGARCSQRLRWRELRLFVCTFPSIGVMIAAQLCSQHRTHDSAIRKPKVKTNALLVIDRKWSSQCSRYHLILFGGVLPTHCSF